MDYKILKLKIKEIFNTQEAFSEALGMSLTALNQRLNNVTEWKTPEIVKACQLLSIDLSEAHLYFFTEKVQKNSTQEG